MFGRSLIIVVVLGITISGITAYAQAPDTLWTKWYGGQDEDWGTCVQQTDDGGFIVVGRTGFDTSLYDVLLMKTDANGTEEWSQTYGDSGPDYGYSVLQTDGGYIIAGSKDAGFNHADGWLIMTDTVGDTIWTKTYGEGGSCNDAFHCIQKTEDGGYIIVGHTQSYGADSTDIWLVKTNAAGDSTEWMQIYNRPSGDNGFCVQQTDDGGYILVGTENIEGADSSNVLLIKTDADGDSTWERVYGGSSWEVGHSVKQTNDGGYIIAGHTHSYSAGGGSDIWLIKTDANGDTTSSSGWMRTYGNEDLDEWTGCVQLAHDGGYIISATTNSGASNYDIWLIKTDDDGVTEWTKTIGGSSPDQLDHSENLQLTSDGGYIVTGVTSSYGAGNWDVYLIRIKPPISIDLTPLFPPIIIPPEGGIFELAITVTNNTNIQQTFDVWCTIETPSGLQFPVVGPASITMDSISFASRIRSQNVPESAPGGEYIYWGAVGTYPWEVVNSDSFTFIKEGFDGPWTGFEGWISSGELFPGEINPGETYLTPTGCTLHNSHPNPFNPTTTISFTLPEPGLVRLEVFDIRGREVGSAQDPRGGRRPLREGWMAAGQHQITFDGSALSSGIYIYRITAGEVSTSGKMVLMK
ncbi:hypothetical protein CEE37_08615 [candidate division LCP-89 bacterium B3_LCP]|uniref:RbmA-like FnIII domain-containing protein n=1 Tax=candidate division LCP-89 bacterium B3_LCP TaxID=2012998 RepID=A0A532UZI7_UNCL8|nr:MAG: hypothetical protein CEE37_08615 [candidate division LCP-89 bacterium B3_LCP]